jgi:gamma-glutamyltranspeptidase/glutathione hydrolase
MALATILAPAIELAEGGFPVSPLTAHHWQHGVAVLTHSPASAAGELLVDGTRAPRAGEIFKNPTLAATLKELAAGGKAAFYGAGSRIGAAIVDAVTRAGGVMTAADLAAHTTTYPDPISIVYRGVSGI